MTVDIDEINIVANRQFIVLPDGSTVEDVKWPERSTKTKITGGFDDAAGNHILFSLDIPSEFSFTTTLDVPKIQAERR